VEVKFKNGSFAVPLRDGEEVTQENYILKDSLGGVIEIYVKGQLKKRYLSEEQFVIPLTSRDHVELMVEGNRIVGVRNGILVNTKIGMSMAFVLSLKQPKKKNLKRLLQKKVVSLRSAQKLQDMSS
jgi:hypothetical protein